ncbi:hypothetical protein D3C85_749520 [compost metagenome]
MLVSVLASSAVICKAMALSASAVVCWSTVRLADTSSTVASSEVIRCDRASSSDALTLTSSAKEAEAWAARRASCSSPSPSSSRHAARSADRSVAWAVTTPSTSSMLAELVCTTAASPPRSSTRVPTSFQ